MPAQFSMPPDTRAVGTGNPPADVNAHTDALAAMGATYNVLSTAFAGGADPTGVADSTAAFQAALTAATNAPNGEMVIPPGTYNCNTGGLQLTGPVRIRGLGGGPYYYGGTLFSGVTLLYNGASGLFTFPWLGYLWGGFEMVNVGITHTGTGNMFHGVNWSDAVFRDCEFTITSPGAMFLYCTGSTSCMNVNHQRCTFKTTSMARTNPWFSITSSIGAAVSNNEWYKCRFVNAGLDSAQPMIYVACSGAGSAYHFEDNLRECWFEHPFGGVYKSLSGMNINVENCTVWDVQNGQTVATTGGIAAGSNGGTISAIASWAFPSAGVLAVTSIPAGVPTSGQLSVAASGPTTAIVSYTGISGNTFTGCAYIGGSPSGTVATGGAVSINAVVGNSLYYFGAYAGNSGSQGVRVTGCDRNLNGPDGVATWDVYCEATTSNVKVEQYLTSPLNPSTTYNVYLNFNGCQDVQLDNCQSPQGAAVNGNSTTVVTSPGTPTFVAGELSLQQAPTLLRGVAGQAAETFPRVLASAVSSALTPGTLYCASIPMLMGTLVTNLNFVTDSTAKTGGTHGWYVLMDKNMKVIGVTADQTDAATVWGTINTAYPLAVTVPFIIAVTTYYFIGVMVNETAGTMPTFVTGPAVRAGVLGGSQGLCGFSSTAQTTPPAIGATMTAMTSNSGYSFYAYTT